MSERSPSTLLKPLAKLRISLAKRLHALGGRRYVVKRVAGARMLLDVNNYIDKRVLAWGHWERDQIDRLFSLAAEARAAHFFDVGSCWGLYSLRAAVDYKIPNIRAFEPDAVNRSQLFANLFLNGLCDAVDVLPFAISDECGTVKMDRTSDKNRGENAVSDQGALSVESRRLDSLVELRGEALAIKIDVEGHELAALAGMADTLRSNHGVIQIETGQQGQVASVLQRAGWSAAGNLGEDHYFVKRAA